MTEKKLKIIALLKLYMTDKQMHTLQSLAKYREIYVSEYSAEEFFGMLQDADVIIAKKKFLKYKRLYDLENKVIIIPFGKEDFWKYLDAEKLKKQGIIIKHISRRYKEALGEWVVFMMLLLIRGINEKINTTEPNVDKNLEMRRSLYGKKVTILGDGVVGSHVEYLCRTFGMDVTVYRRYDDLIEKSKYADIIVNCLKNDPNEPPLLNRNFFMSLKKGVIFISVASNSTYDLGALKEAMEKGIVAKIADDSASAPVGSTDNEIYRELLSMKNTFVTPHIAWRTDVEAELSYDKLIEYIKNLKEERSG